MVGDAQVFVGELIDGDRFLCARICAGVLQHSFYDGIRPFSMLVDLFFILPDIIGYMDGLFYIATFQLLYLFVDKVFIDIRKIGYKVQGFWISWAIPAVSSPRDAIFSACISCACADSNTFNVFSTIFFWASTFSFSSLICAVATATFVQARVLIDNSLGVPAKDQRNGRNNDCRIKQVHPPGSPPGR